MEFELGHIFGLNILEHQIAAFTAWCTMGSNPFLFQYKQAFTRDIFETFLSTLIGRKTEEIVVKKDAAQSAVQCLTYYIKENSGKI